MLNKCLQSTPGSGHETPTIGAGERQERAGIQQPLYTGIGEGAMWEPVGKHEEAGLASASCSSPERVTGFCFHKAGSQF